MPDALLERTRNPRHSFRIGTVSLTLPALNLCVALWLLALLNLPFWRALWHAVGESWDASRAGYLLSLPVFVLLWVWLSLECLTWGRAAKPVLGVLLLASAAAAYFMDAYGIVYDRSMIASIVGTDVSEARELLSLRMLLWLLVLGAAPIWLLARVRINPRPWHRQLLSKAMTFGILISSTAVLVVPFFQSYATLLRNHRELRLQLVPSNYLTAAHSYVKTRFAGAHQFQLVRIDARRDVITGQASKPTLTVIVIGETARAANFGLNGYTRQTTPQLATEADLINFRKVRSCGTSTEVSLPCMFLDMGQAGFTDGLAARRENLLDVLQRAGFRVLWRDNNSGCKGLCDRVPQEDLTRAAVPELCEGGECYDEVLLHGLQEKLDAFDGDAVVVLHMKGSHGPAYYLRYPPQLEYFQPACRTIQLDRCERDTIANAYDNTLRYTDYVLARTIELLRHNADRFDAWLVYASDHGESLGERGLYLHGVPYAFAPTEQTHIPMVMWFSVAAQKRFGVDMACLGKKQNEALSHDNLYHSTIGLLDVRASVYRAERDIFRNCRADHYPMIEASAEGRMPDLPASP